MKSYLPCVTRSHKSTVFPFLAVSQLSTLALIPSVKSGIQALWVIYMYGYTYYICINIIVFISNKYICLVEEICFHLKQLSM